MALIKLSVPKLRVLGAMIFALILFQVPFLTCFNRIQNDKREVKQVSPIEVASLVMQNFGVDPIVIQSILYLGYCSQLAMIKARCMLIDNPLCSKINEQSLYDVWYNILDSTFPLFDRQKLMYALEQTYQDDVGLVTIGSLTIVISSVAGLFLASKIMFFGLGCLIYVSLMNEVQISPAVWFVGGLTFFNSEIINILIKSYQKSQRDMKRPEPKIRIPGDKYKDSDEEEELKPDLSKKQMQKQKQKQKNQRVFQKPKEK